MEAISLTVTLRDRTEHRAAGRKLEVVPLQHTPEFAESVIAVRTRRPDQVANQRLKMPPAAVKGSRCERTDFTRHVIQADRGSRWQTSA